MQTVAQPIAPPHAHPTPQSAPPESAGFLGVSWMTWLKVAAVVVAFAWLFLPNLTRLWQKTNFISGDKNWYHAMTIPLVGLYFLFLHRDELIRTSVEPLLGDRLTRWRFLSAAGLVAGGAVGWLAGRFGLVPEIESTISLADVVQNVGLGVMVWGVLVLLLDWGLGTLLAGLALSAYGIYPGRNDFIWDFGMVVTLFGVVLTLCGWRVMRIVWFPIVFLVCAIPWPQLVYSAVAMPLQKLAAQASVTLMNLLAIDASYGGTKIFLPQYNDLGLRIADRPLNVAEACAGLVSLMSFISISAAVAFLSSRPLWQKLIITASAIPIAILCNVLRVAGVGALDMYAGQEWSEGFAHQFAGMVLLLPAFFLIMLVCWVVDQIFIEEADEDAVAKPVKRNAAPTPGARAGGAA